MKEIYSTLIRNVFKICGPLLAAKGVADEHAIETIGGAVATIFAIVWGIVDARTASKAKAEAKATFARPSQTNT